MYKTLTFLSGTFIGFLLMESLKFFTAGKNLINLIFNENFQNFLSSILPHETKLIILNSSILLFINALTFCVPLGMLAGVFLAKLEYKRLFVYPILIAPFLVTFLNIYRFTDAKRLGVVLGKPELIINARNGYIFTTLNIVICYAVFFTGIYLGHLWFTKRQQKLSAKIGTESPAPQVEQDTMS